MQEKRQFHISRLKKSTAKFGKNVQLGNTRTPLLWLLCHSLVHHNVSTGQFTLGNKTSQLYLELFHRCSNNFFQVTMSRNSHIGILHHKLLIRQLHALKLFQPVGRLTIYMLAIKCDWLELLWLLPRRKVMIYASTWCYTFRQNKECSGST